jgi:hypothetical protein
MMKKKLELPNDLLLAILSFCDDVTLCKCGLVCKIWKEVSDSDLLWERFCVTLWNGKANVQNGQIFQFGIFDQSVNLSVKELKMILQQRGIDTSNFIEKGEYWNALNSSNEQLRVQHPPIKGKWKASYVFSLLDSKRDYMYDTELCSFEWTFFFKTNPADFHSIGLFQTTKNGNVYTMDPWPMDNVSSLTWKRHPLGHVQIHHFPFHVVSRNEDWSFRIENEYVIFFQSNIPTFNLQQAVESLTAQLQN